MCILILPKYLILSTQVLLPSSFSSDLSVSKQFGQNDQLRGA